MRLPKPSTFKLNCGVQTRKLGGIQMNRKIYFAHCPNCGRVLLKGAEIETVELQCGKCNDIIEVKMHDGKIELQSNPKTKAVCT